MVNTNIPPYNSKNKTKKYVNNFFREVGRRFKEYPQKENNFHFYGGMEGISKGEIVLVLNPRMFYIPSTRRGGTLITLEDMLFSSEVVQEQTKCKDVEHLRNTSAKFTRDSGLMYGGYLGESPWEACAGDCGLLCQDGKERFMMNYDVGKGYVFLPHPDFLGKFLEGIEQIPKERLHKEIISQIRE